MIRGAPDPDGPTDESAQTEAPGGTLPDEDKGATEPGAGTPLAPREPGDDEVVPVRRYEIYREIARGGIGRILRARDTRLDRVVALKELRRDDAPAVSRFLREIRLTAHLQHPNIIPLHEAGRWPNGQPFYAMKLVDGRTLATAVAEATSFAERLALLPVLVDVAEAMAYAHSQGIVHRDLKPSNVLVGPFGETVVIDWGLAKHMDEPDGSDPIATIPSEEAYETVVGAVIGTPAYMPPEQAAGSSVDRSADVYAIGAMLYHIVAGKSPYYEHSSDEVVTRVRAGGPVPLLLLCPEAPRDLVAIVEKAMARKPKDRYPTAREMAEELRRYTTGGLVGAYRYGLLELMQRFFDRQRAVVITAIFAVLALSLFAVGSFRSITEQRDRATLSAREAEESNAAKAKQVDELTVEKARALLDRDPTRSVAWLKRPAKPLFRAATIGAWAEERGVAEQILQGHLQQVTTVAYSPDGRQVATGGDDQRVVLWGVDPPASKPLTGHKNRVSRVVFSPDGHLLASASYDRTIRLYDGSGAFVRELLGHESPVKWVAFSHDSARLCSVSLDGDVRVWDASGTRAESHKGAADRDLFCSFSPDGTHLLSGSHASALHVWNLTTGAERSLVSRGGAIHAALFSPDGKTIAAADDDGRLVLWPVRGGTPVELEKTDRALHVLAYSPDGAALAAGGLSGAVRVWDLVHGTSRVVSEHAERVAALAFSADGQFLASSGWDKLVRIRNMSTETSQVLRGHADIVGALAFSPDGKRLASASWDKTVRLWNTYHTHNRRVLKGHTIGVRSVAFSPDGTLVASGGHDNAVRLFDVRTGESRVFVGHSDHVYRIVFSPDGKLLASSSDDRTVRVWSVADGQSRVLSGHREDVEELAFSPDGKLLASASEDDTARLWSLDGSPTVVLEHGNYVTGVAFDATGETLATSSRDGKVRLWNGHVGTLRRVLDEHKQEVYGLAFSRDGKRLASASYDDSVIVWDAGGDRSTRLEHLNGARLVTFSPDGTHVAVAGASPNLWYCDIARKACTPFDGHAAVVHDAAFLPDGRGLVSGSGDGSVHVWDLSTREWRVFEGHLAPVFGVAVSPDGQTIASASGDADVRLWNTALPPHPEKLREFLDGLSHEQLAPGTPNTALAE